VLQPQAEDHHIPGLHQVYSEALLDRCEVPGIGLQVATFKGGDEGTPHAGELLDS
jgi:hypothetical protein